MQVDTLSGGIGGEQYLHLGVVSEGFLRPKTLLATHTAVNDNHRIRTAEQGSAPIHKIAEGVTMLGEHDQLLPGRRRRPGDTPGSVGFLCHAATMCDA